MKIALVHDWLIGMRGGERVLESLCELYPRADLYTLIYEKGSISPIVEDRRIFTSFIQRLPFAQRGYRYYLPLMPKAIESFDFKDYDLIISSSHCVAKGIIPRNALHICYCHTPMRYIWEMYGEYKQRLSIFAKMGLSIYRPYLKRWDVNSAQRVDYFIANSKNVAHRIKKCYNKESTVIYPPVDTKGFNLSSNSEDFYLIVSAFAPYKRIDLAIEAFNILGYPLKIIGRGEDVRFKKIAGANIEFLGWQSDEVVRDYYARCKAVIFPGEEDFGLVPLEAMAAGKPVIAYAKGGALETVKEGETGLFFYPQSPSALIEAIQQFEKKIGNFNSERIRQYALSFDKEVFKRKIKRFIKDRLHDVKKIQSGF